MDHWEPAAVKAIDLSRSWAEAAAKEVPGRYYLFGSSVYQGGKQFDPVGSDLDLVYVFPGNESPVGRAATLEKLLVHKEELELKVIRALGRKICDEPGISVVPVTAFELETNIHKSGSRRFFERNYFYDLLNGSLELGIPGAGTKMVSDDHRHPLEYVQKTRNAYLAVAANGEGGLTEFSGVEPLPKDLTRMAALMLKSDEASGEWYDTARGLEALSARLNAAVAKLPDLKELAERVSVRRGARGRRQALSGHDQLVLAELLFEMARSARAENVAFWELRIVTPEGVVVDPDGFFAGLRRLVPEAELISTRVGSVILKVRSSERSFYAVEQLTHEDALPSLLGTSSACEIARIDVSADATSSRFEGSRQDPVEELIRQLREWAPTFDNESALEASLRNWLAAWTNGYGFSGLRALGGSAKSNLDNPITQLELVPQIGFAPIPGMRPVVLDFLLHRKDRPLLQDKVGIELKVVREPTAFLQTLERLMVLDFPVICVVFGTPAVTAEIRPMIRRLAKLPGKLTVLTKTIQGNPEIAIGDPLLGLDVTRPIRFEGDFDLRPSLPPALKHLKSSDGSDS